jgi:hypothetical protein
LRSRIKQLFVQGEQRAAASRCHTHSPSFSSRAGEPQREQAHELHDAATMKRSRVAEQERARANAELAVVFASVIAYIVSYAIVHSRPAGTAPGKPLRADSRLRCERPSGKPHVNAIPR